MINFRLNPLDKRMNKNELNDNPIIPTKYLDNIKNTQLLNLDYKIKIWSGYKCDQFIKKYFPNKEVFLFEPLPKNADIIKKHFSINFPDSQYHLIQTKELYVKISIFVLLVMPFPGVSRLELEK